MTQRPSIVAEELMKNDERPDHSAGADGAAQPAAPDAGADRAGVRIPVVDDDPTQRRLYSRMLARVDWTLELAADGPSAIEILASRPVDVIVSDIMMPGMDGVQLLRAIRERDLDVPVLMVTGTPELHTAIDALEHGAFRYLSKPVDPVVLRKAVADAARLHLLARLKREAFVLLGESQRQVGDRAGLEASFGRALHSLWMAYQPIVCWSEGRVVAYEALLRSNEPTLPNPVAVLEAAERLGSLGELGRAVREAAAGAVGELPPAASLYVNLHPQDLLDDTLFASVSPLSRVAGRVVLEITERALLTEVAGVRSRVAALRRLGFRIAIDDLGAGYAGLASFAQLEPDIVKLDLSLVRDVDAHPLKRKLVRAMVGVCADLGIKVVAEGVETYGERDVLIDLGCDLLQGYLFAKPAWPMPGVAPAALARALAVPRFRDRQAP